MTHDEKWDWKKIFRIFLQNIFYKNISADFF